MSRELTPAERRQRRLAPIRTGIYSSDAKLLKSRYRRVQRLASRVRDVVPWLEGSDEPTLRAWSELELLGASIWADLMARGAVNEQGEPRRLLSEYRQLRQIQLRYGEALGLTPAARASLGRNVAGAGADLALLFARAARGEEA